MSPEILALLQYQKAQQAQRQPAQINPEDFSLMPDRKRFEPQPISSAWLTENAQARYRQMMGDSIKQNQPAPAQESLVPQRGAAMSPEQMAATHPLLNPNSPVLEPIGISGKFRRGPSETISADARLIQRNVPYADMVDPSEIERLENYRKALLNQKQQGNIAPFLGWIEDEYGARNLVRTYEKPQDLSDKAVAITRTIHNLKRGVTQDKISILNALLKAKKKDEKDVLDKMDLHRIRKDFMNSEDKKQFDKQVKFTENLKRYREALEGVTGPQITGRKAAELSSLYNKMLVTLNRYEAELGALAGQDLNILRGILRPTGGPGSFNINLYGGVEKQREILDGMLSFGRTKAGRLYENLHTGFSEGAEDLLIKYANRLGEVWGAKGYGKAVRETGFKPAASKKSKVRTKTPSRDRILQIINDPSADPVKVQKAKQILNQMNGN